MNTAELAKTYRDIGFRDGANLQYVLEPMATHNEDAWRGVACGTPLSASGSLRAQTPRAMRIHALPIFIAAICILAIAYRFYSAFIAAKVFALDGKTRRQRTPGAGWERLHSDESLGAVRSSLRRDHGAGPLIGPVLAAQFFAGPLWILVGVTLAGAVHDSDAVSERSFRVASRWRRWRDKSWAHGPDRWQRWRSLPSQSRFRR